VSLGFPSWYKGGFPDREKVVEDILTPVLNTIEVFDVSGNLVVDNGVARRPKVYTRLPKDYTEKLPVVRLFRGGGAADMGVLSDPASVQVATIADTRADSWDLMEFCRMWLLSFERGGSVRRADGSITAVKCIEELVGPQLLPELRIDDRLVPLTFRVDCRLPRGLPDYAKVRESLSH
jgi:hypothetical protein